MCNKGGNNIWNKNIDIDSYFGKARTPDTSLKSCQNHIDTNIPGTFPFLIILLNLFFEIKIKTNYMAGYLDERKWMKTLNWNWCYIIVRGRIFFFVTGLEKKQTFKKKLFYLILVRRFLMRRISEFYSLGHIT